MIITYSFVACFFHLHRVTHYMWTRTAHTYVVPRCVTSRTVTHTSTFEIQSIGTMQAKPQSSAFETKNFPNEFQWASRWTNEKMINTLWRDVCPHLCVCVCAPSSLSLSNLSTRYAKAKEKRIEWVWLRLTETDWGDTIHFKMNSQAKSHWSEFKSKGKERERERGRRRALAPINRVNRFFGRFGRIFDSKTNCCICNGCSLNVWAFYMSMNCEVMASHQIFIRFNWIKAVWCAYVFDVSKVLFAFRLFSSATARLDAYVFMLVYYFDDATTRFRTYVYM